MPTSVHSDRISRVLLSTPSVGRQSWSRQVGIAFAASALVALCAHLSIPVPFTPIPVTMQTFAVLLVGILFGPALGAATLVLYLVEGALGFPVFAPHGVGGIAQLAGPSAGYLLSYPVAALLAGKIFKHGQDFLLSSLATLVSSLLGDAVILLSGSAWLMASPLHLSLVHAVQAGILPFLTGECVKLALLTIFIPALQRARLTR